MKGWRRRLNRHALCACALTALTWVGARDARAQQEVIKADEVLGAGVGTTSALLSLLGASSFSVMSMEDYGEMERLSEEEAIFRQLSLVDEYIDAHGPDAAPERRRGPEDAPRERAGRDALQ